MAGRPWALGASTPAGGPPPAAAPRARGLYRTPPPRPQAPWPCGPSCWALRSDRERGGTLTPRPPPSRPQLHTVDQGLGFGSSSRTGLAAPHLLVPSELRRCDHRVPVDEAGLARALWRGTLRCRPGSWPGCWHCVPQYSLSEGAPRAWVPSLSRWWPGVAPPGQCGLGQGRGAILRRGPPPFSSPLRTLRKEPFAKVPGSARKVEATG